MYRYRPRIEINRLAKSWTFSHFGLAFVSDQREHQCNQHTSWIIWNCSQWNCRNYLSCKWLIFPLCAPTKIRPYNNIRTTLKWIFASVDLCKKCVFIYKRQTKREKWYIYINSLMIATSKVQYQANCFCLWLE